ncbi:thioredoxin family protein [Enterococcus gallinarum]|uniref:Thioredoxin family protein n=2 Tax=Enterococcus gallinarum TaxID=1353 RepID=A0ABD4ZXC0_ENTGA|nr:thioredoxin family protein [Enterococcus gallinarum]MCR1945920.1 thioredoxin family protein [Enterococcus gallinarum]MDL4876768.1 thioredoxin family protein [Enterococcus gallinarum]MDL4883304.1 thioredoxin family protein [Enterococcus gallinarum]MDL4886741.1 thioredoxin family protein [Enterococcus gallinarum]MDL4895579.1 thioredoxin family protein [Enterococcus gallinarum]
MKKKFLLSFATFLVLFGTTFLISMKNFEDQKQPVEISEKESRVIVFYRDDCPDCQKVFPFLYARNLVFNDLLFVNMNSESNRKYIDQYSLESVPTFVSKGDFYSGISLEKIYSLIQQED